MALSIRVCLHLMTMVCSLHGVFFSVAMFHTVILVTMQPISNIKSHTLIKVIFQINCNLKSGQNSDLLGIQKHS